MTTKRTTHRSKAGAKLYAVRDKDGRFKDVQTYKRAHAADLRQKSKAEQGTLAWGVYGPHGLLQVNLVRAHARFRANGRTAWAMLDCKPARYTVRRVRVTPV